MPINCTFGEEIQTTSAEQSSSHIEESASANSDGLDFGALQEYGFTIPANELANAVKLGLKPPTKFPNDKESRVTCAQQWHRVV